MPDGGREYYLQLDDLPQDTHVGPEGVGEVRDVGVDHPGLRCDAG
jgi:hypothetical protein